MKFRPSPPSPHHPPICQTPTHQTFGFHPSLSRYLTAGNQTEFITPTKWIDQTLLENDYDEWTSDKSFANCRTLGSVDLWRRLFDTIFYTRSSFVSYGASLSPRLSTCLVEFLLSLSLFLLFSSLLISDSLFLNLPLYVLFSEALSPSRRLFVLLSSLLYLNRAILLLFLPLKSAFSPSLFLTLNADTPF